METAPRSVTSAEYELFFNIVDFRKDKQPEGGA